MTDIDKYPLLKNIQSPTDLHSLGRPELKALCGEIRQALLDNISKTGGHFASNLGTVELTVALYATFSLPPDKICWDTGHQAYPHKMLTGRLAMFDGLRQTGGISGFLRMTESEHDHWGAGHACTAISAALGYAVARDKRGADERVVAITGDAALTGGMAWEALNNAAALETDLTVVLNDNNMSIANSVGSLSHHFAKLRSRPWFQDAENRVRRAVERLPKPMVKAAAGFKHSVTHYFAPEDTGAIFEELGFEYIGPIDGHDLDVLLDVLVNVRSLKGPVFVHAITVKGKGYEMAEGDARKWHGVTPFDPDTCEMSSSSGPISYTNQFGETLLSLAKDDPKIMAITAAMPDGTGLTKFGKELPGQYFDVGIAEQHAVTFAAGLAAGGLKPACAIYSTFLQRGWDQVLHDVAIQNLPVRFFMDRAGLVGADGTTHHGAFDIGYLMMIPNFVLLAPRDTTELGEMIRFAMDYDKGPIAVRYPRGSADDTLPESRTPIAFGKAEPLRHGSDVALIGYGSTTALMNRAADVLAQEGIDAAVLNLRFAKPLDEEEILGLARRTRRLVVAEENVAPGGIGEAILKLLHENGLGDIPVRMHALPDRFIEHGSQSDLLREAGLTVAAFAEAAESLVRS
ncbi:MAG TPA: 1-deoxy-D-xylulose-5-phosphate synthase [Fimbriimonadales bacterium]|jgi:1-deoxy-D-xylulose-5-phosphate synthase|nr:1-deoxy-D-xylulose-5-phosphate synthase [Fimbriimonadales bacterium]